jgi:NAD(P)H-hydrate epimerase
MNKHEFQQAVKKFRAGRITLEQLTELVYPAAEAKSATSSGTQAAAERVTAALPCRADDAHKGDFGRVLVIGGSRGMSGAIRLTGMAALRSGSGLVTVATPESERAEVAGFTPCYMTLGLPETRGLLNKDAVDELLEKCDGANVVAIGPGMGRSRSLQKVMSLLYTQLPQTVVIDADGLNNLADGETDLSRHEGARILTPHPGEFQRVAKLPDTNDRQLMEKRADELAASSNLTIVLKGHRTLITNGASRRHNNTGNPGMATAGSGDVLTGIIAALVGQGMSAFDAATLGVHVHGLAGDLGARDLGQVSLVSTDLLDYLPKAFAAL